MQFVMNVRGRGTTRADLGIGTDRGRDVAHCGTRAKNWGVGKDRRNEGQAEGCDDHQAWAE